MQRTKIQKNTQKKNQKNIQKNDQQQRQKVLQKNPNCLDDVQKKPTLINNMQRINEMHLNLNFSSLMFNMYIVCTAPISRT